MSRVKGLKSDQFTNNSKVIVQNLELTPYTKVLASNLSHGNKRKLAFAMTLLVRPEIEFLDELTTGVDPCSRRGLYKMIRSLKEE